MLRNHPPMPTEVREMRIQYEAGQSLDRVGEQFDYFAKTVRRVRHGTRSAVSVAEDALIRRVWGALIACPERKMAAIGWRALAARARSGCRRTGPLRSASGVFGMSADE